MRNSATKLIRGVLAVLAAQAWVGTGLLIIAPGIANSAVSEQAMDVAGAAGRALDDDTGGNQDAEPPHSEDEAPSKDETPQLDDPEDPPPSGCIFDRKPLQLMV